MGAYKRRPYNWIYKINMNKVGIKIINLSYAYLKNREKKEILSNINLEIKKHDFVTIFGPNGSGKTTLLNIIAGFIKPDKGEVRFPGKKKFKISYIFQNYRESLFPWMTVFDNIAYPLKVKKMKKDKIRKEVAAICKKFDVNFDLNTYPYLLSGGQQQLVAIMRGFIEKPDLVLMDEPFAALDYHTRLVLELKLQEIWEKSKATIIFISHDLREAIMLADKMVIFKKNKSTEIADILINPLKRPRLPAVVTNRKFIESEKKVMTILKLNRLLRTSRGV